MCMSRPARVWLFKQRYRGALRVSPPSEHRKRTRHGLEGRHGVYHDGKIRAGGVFRGGTQLSSLWNRNNHNTWYAATMVDARGVEIPYVDRDGKELKTVSERYYPAPGQKFFLKGGVIDNPKYEYRGPETLDFDTLMKRGYQLPFYADLSRMPEMERKVIWGMMVGRGGQNQDSHLRKL